MTVPKPEFDPYAFLGEHGSFLRWCVLTVSKGFTAADDGQERACEVLAAIDAEAERRARARVVDACPVCGTETIHVPCAECHDVGTVVDDAGEIIDCPECTEEP
jgi:uncharacterized protein with PIN domain